MVRNVIKGSFPISKVLNFGDKSFVRGKNEDFRSSKVLVFEGNSYVCGKNEDIRLFYDCIW